MKPKPVGVGGASAFQAPSTAEAKLCSCVMRQIGFGLCKVVCTTLHCVHSPWAAANAAAAGLADLALNAQTRKPPRT